jgi:hypothetical protein
MEAHLMDIVTHWYRTAVWYDELEQTAMRKLGVTHVNYVDALDVPTPDETLLEGLTRAIRNLRLLDECDLSPKELILILRDTREWAERWSILSPKGERFAALAARIEKDFKQLKKGKVPQ